MSAHRVLTISSFDGARKVPGRWRRSQLLLHAGLQALLLVACAPKVSLRVPQEALDELPLERKLTLLDAENDRLAAIDARDAQEEAVQKALDAKRDAEQRRRAAEDNRDKAQGKVADAAVREAEAKVEVREREIEVARKELDISEAALLVAEARFEETRAGEVSAAALGHSHGVHIDDYRKQVGELQAVLTEKAVKAKEQRKSADEAAARWKTARAELGAMTAGAQGSAWVQ
jgi:hypothetical protein